MMKHVNYKHCFSYVSMIAFGYPKLTFDTSMTFIRYDCRLWINARTRFYHDIRLMFLGR